VAGKAQYPVKLAALLKWLINFLSIHFCASYSVSSTGAYPVSQLEDICLAERYFQGLS